MTTISMIAVLRGLALQRPIRAARLFEYFRRCHLGPFLLWVGA
jgi:hypothetical protein